MASYNGNVDLLSLNGAKVLVGIDEKNVKRPYVCIPLDVNEIRIETYQKDNVNRQVAKLRVHIEPFKDSYKNKIRQSNIERGDTEKSVPTHEMQISFSTEYVKAVAKAFPKLVEQVKEYSKEKDPDIVNQDFNDENSHLFKAIRTRMNKRIASLYQPQTATQQQTYPQQVYGAAGNATAYVPPADGGNYYSSMPGYDDPNSDLPF